MQKQLESEYRINSQDLEEYFASLARGSESAMDDDLKLRELMRTYAELKFRMVGGSKCAVCRSHVRHVFPVISEQSSGELKKLDCLCTRCFEGEKFTAVRMMLVVGENQVRVRLERPEAEPIGVKAFRAAKSRRA